MKSILLKSSFVASAVAVLMGTTSTLSAQAVKVTAEVPTFADLQSPEFGGTTGREKSFKPKNWLEMEGKARIEIKPEPASKMAEQVLVKWYVAIKNPDGKGTLLLSRDVTHVNVPLGQDIYFSVYLTPASIQRITGSDRAGKGAVSIVGYEVIVNGEQAATATTRAPSGLPDEWWTFQSPLLSRSETVPLLSKPESAFANMWWDRYAEVLPERR